MALKANIFIKENILSLYLLFYFVLICSLVVYCYPFPQFTWDSAGYIDASASLIPNIRSIGYSIFLRILYEINSSIYTVVIAQFALYFVSVLFFLKAVKSCFAISGKSYLLLGFVLLSEPTMYYFSNTMLSDNLFACLTWLFLSFLILYINSRKFIFLITTFVLSLVCLETRQIGMFYLFFFLAVLIVYEWKQKLQLVVKVAAMIALFLLLYATDSRRNEKNYGVKIFSAFQGWMAANNSLFVLQRVKIRSQAFEDPELRNLNTFFSNYLDSTSVTNYTITRGFLWDDDSPLCYLRKKTEDSLKIDFTTAWFRLAPVYKRFGLYIQTHYPYEYLMAFVVPNFKTFIAPDYGEMSDYYIMKNPDDGAFRRYKKHNTDMVCRYQPFRNMINRYTTWYYQIRLVLLLCVSFIVFRYRKTFEGRQMVFFVISVSFVYLYLFLSLCANIFLSRELLPVLPVITSCIYLTIANRVKRTV